MPQLADLTVAEFVEAVGKDQPAPGCGGAAALGLALAAACARKVLAISARRHGGVASLAEAAERCRIIAEAALQGAQRDADNFRALLAAAGREDGPASRLEGDAQVLIGLAAELRQMLEDYADGIAPNVEADAAAALTLIEAFERIEMRNVLEL
jgi:hypothetical protein